MVPMKTLEKGQEKIQKICSVLREETLEPAQQEAREIIDAAHKQAEAIIAAAEKSAEKLHLAAKESIHKEHNVFQASLLQASKQSLEALRQSIEARFFNTQLSAIIEKNAAEPQLVANLINAIAKALEKEGLAADLTALIPKNIAPRQVNELLLKEVLEVLKDKSVKIGSISAGAQVKLHNRNLTIDISEDALKELLASYVVRKDFRKLIFEI